MTIEIYTSPKSLIIRNEFGGMIWQCYRVHNSEEVRLLSKTAKANGFLSVQLEQGMDDVEETWPGWRDTDTWKEYYERETGKPVEA